MKKGLVSLRVDTLSEMGTTPGKFFSRGVMGSQFRRITLAAGLRMGCFFPSPGKR